METTLSELEAKVTEVSFCYPNTAWCSWIVAVS
jgi:hypothetical protein